MSPLIKDTLKDLGLAPSKTRGQNFLKDEGAIDRIVRAALAFHQGPGQPKVLEIGPGLGALTWPLLEAGARVWAVELDGGLAENLERRGAELAPDNLRVLNQDVLALDPAPIAREAGGPLIVCGNLPYNISSPILFWFVRHRRLAAGGLFMLQKEMAARVLAEPGGKDYGRLAAALSLWSRPALVASVPPSAFHPRPRVESVVLSLAPLPPEQEPDLEPEAFGRFTALAFQARRKTILNNLSAAFGRERSLAALAALGLNPALRPEKLPPETLAALAKALEPAGIDI